MNTFESATAPNTVVPAILTKPAGAAAGLAVETLYGISFELSFPNSSTLTKKYL